jgi:hypothetical protein
MQTVLLKALRLRPLCSRPPALVRQCSPLETPLLKALRLKAPKLEAARAREAMFDSRPSSA